MRDGGAPIPDDAAGFRAPAEPDRSASSGDTPDTNTLGETPVWLESGTSDTRPDFGAAWREIRNVPATARPYIQRRITGGYIEPQPETEDQRNTREEQERGNAERDRVEKEYQAERESRFFEAASNLDYAARHDQLAAANRFRRAGGGPGQRAKERLLDTKRQITTRAIVGGAIGAVTGGGLGALGGAAVGALSGIGSEAAKGLVRMARELIGNDRSEAASARLERLNGERLKELAGIAKRYLEASDRGVAGLEEMRAIKAEFLQVATSDQDSRNSEISSLLHERDESEKIWKRMETAASFAGSLGSVYGADFVANQFEFITQITEVPEVRSVVQFAERALWVCQGLVTGREFALANARQSTIPRNNRIDPSGDNWIERQGNKFKNWAARQGQDKILKGALNERPKKEVYNSEEDRSLAELTTRRREALAHARTTARRATETFFNSVQGHDKLVTVDVENNLGQLLRDLPRALAEELGQSDSGINLEFGQGDYELVGLDPNESNRHNRRRYKLVNIESSISPIENDSENDPTCRLKIRVQVEPVRDEEDEERMANARRRNRNNRNNQRRQEHDLDDEQDDSEDSPEPEHDGERLRNRVLSLLNESIIPHREVCVELSEMMLVYENGRTFRLGLVSWDRAENRYVVASDIHVAPDVLRSRIEDCQSIERDPTGSLL